MAAAEAADHGAELIVVNVWEHTILPPAGTPSVSERYAPFPSERTTEDLVNEVKEVLGRSRRCSFSRTSGRAIRRGC